MVLKKKEEFADETKILVEKEGIKLENIVYYPIGSFDPDSVPYSLKDLKLSVEVLYLSDYEKDSYRLVQCLNRMFGLGFCFVSRDWFSFFCDLVKHKNHTWQLPTFRMVEVRKNWTEISQYIHSGGKKKTEVKGVNINLGTVRNILYILHSKEGTAEEKKIRKEGLPELPRVIWNNPAPARIKPNPKCRFSTFAWVPVFSGNRTVGSRPVFAGSIAGRFMFSAGSIPGRFMFSAGSIAGRFMFSAGSIAGRFMFSAGSIP